MQENEKHIQQRRAQKVNNSLFNLELNSHTELLSTNSTETFHESTNEHINSSTELSYTKSRHSNKPIRKPHNVNSSTELLNTKTKNSTKTNHKLKFKHGVLTGGFMQQSPFLYQVQHKIS